MSIVFFENLLKVCGMGQKPHTTRKEDFQKFVLEE